MFRLGRSLQVFFGAYALFSVAPAYAQPRAAEYRSTTVWWAGYGRIRETGSPSLTFALPVIGTDRVHGLIRLNCPQRSNLGPFIEIPGSIWSLGPLAGKDANAYIAVNGEAFVGFVDKDRWLLYLNANPIALDAQKATTGSTVRKALLASKDRLSIGSGPSPSLVLKTTFDDDASPTATGVFGPLIVGGFQPTGPEEALKRCEDFAAGGSGSPPVQAFDATKTWFKGRVAFQGGGPPATAITLPMLQGNRVAPASGLICPEKPGTTPYLQFPLAELKLEHLKGHRFPVSLVLNGQAFIGHVNGVHATLSFASSGTPGVLGAKKGESVRAALRATKDKLEVGTEATPVLVATLNDAHPATSAVVEHLKKQGRQPVSLDQGLKDCDAVSKPPATPAAKSAVKPAAKPAAKPPAAPIAPAR